MIWKAAWELCGLVSVDSMLYSTVLALMAFRSSVYRLAKSVSERVLRTDWVMKYVEAGVNGKRLSSYFLIGALFSLVKAPCVGAVYLAILDVISARSYAEGAVYLVFYNLGIVLPIILLGGLIALGMSPEQVDKFRKDYRATIRLVTGLALLALAPLIYFQLI